MKLIINQKLWALKSIMCKDRTRYGLRGIVTDGTHAVATDGRAIVAVTNRSDPLPPCWFVVPVFPSRLPRECEVVVEVENPGVYSVPVTGEDAPKSGVIVFSVFKDVEPFPNWRPIVPKTDPGKFQRLNCALLSSVLDASSLVRGTWRHPTCIDIHVDGDKNLSPVTIHGADEGDIVIIMPMRPE